MNSYHDVVVIGAGLQGLAAAHIYTQVEPDVDLLIIDSNDSVGGTWAKENLYPGLRSNNLIGTYEYTDFPMHEGFDVKKDQHIPGEVIHGYFCQYAEKFDLTRRLLLSNKVVTAENVQEGWKLRVVPTRPTESKPPQTITTAKLIVATGLTSSSRPISLPGKDGFQRPLLTFGSFRHKAPALLASPTINHVAVYGGSKAAYDCVYLFANAGKRVSWIISASGYGPTFMAPAYIYLGPFRRWLEKLAATRLFTFFSPCIWGDADGFGYLRNLLHQTSLGRFVVDKFWGQLGSDVVTQTGLDKHPELKKLKPDDGAFWYATGLGILNYPKDIHEFVRNGTVTIIRKDIKTLEKGGKVILADGSEISAEAMVCSTGWNYASGFKFLPETLHAELGIPSTSFCKTQTEIWDTLTAKADAEILERFPRLARQPRIGKKPPAGTQEAPPLSQIRPASEKPDGMTPWRLWRGIAPPVNPEKNLVFLGMMFMLHGALRSEISSLWAYAYMNDKLSSPLFSLATSAPSDTPLSPPENSEHKTQFTISNKTIYETALTSRFFLWRYPYGYGARFPDFVFDGIPYFDLLLRDLGLRSWRKGWGWFGEVVWGGSYGQRDYGGLVEEWVGKYGGRGGGGRGREEVVGLIWGRGLVDKV